MPTPMNIKEAEEKLELMQGLITWANLFGDNIKNGYSKESFTKFVQMRHVIMYHATELEERIKKAKVNTNI